jgi:4-diphosphocytidyl-2-C-methyl-D-erythritol kinase
MRSWTIPYPVRLFAPAKVNLALEVCGRRPDGLHEVVTLMETVSLFDVIDLKPATDLTTVSDERIDRADELTRRALHLLEQHTELKLGLDVTVQKNIPIAAGLGGGSSDAGTVIDSIGRLLGLTREELHPIAASLGADVPFFLDGGVALATGTGTDLTPLVVQGRRWYVIAVPELDITGKTATLYRSLNKEDFTGGNQARELAERLNAQGNFPRHLLINAFQRPLLEYEPFARTVRPFNEAGSEHAVASGAGPSVFTTCESYQLARALARQVSKVVPATFIATSIGPNLNLSRL